ncbi:hypothetical protein HBA54_28465, partial [Pelagibius litoralis]
MPRANPLQAAFNAGEIGPRMAARVDFAKYQNAGSRVENMIPLPQGGLTRRPGTRYVAAARDHDKRPRLIPFEFSTEQAYVLEVCDRCFRFFRNKGQIIVPATDAAITNGDFDTDLTGWDDRSSGGGAIEHNFLGGDEIDLLDFAQTALQGWGDFISGRANVGLKFTAPADGDVANASISVPVVTVGFTAVAGVYADNGGNPGVQVGADSTSVVINTPTLYTFTWAANPTITSGSTYWIVFSDITLGGTGNATISQCADRGAAFASGFNDTITLIANNGGGWINGRDLRTRIGIESAGSNGVLALEGNGSGVASAEQAVATTDLNQEHVIRFRVIGAAGDKVAFRIGNTSEGDQVISEIEMATGFHSVAFTPTMSPFYVQFRNEANKTIFIDSVGLIGSGAVTPAPFELASPYGEADLPTLKRAQSADVMYFAHPDCAPHKLERRGNTTWSLVEVAFADGPYLDENTVSGQTLDPSAVSGNGITITAVGHSPFVDGDVGRLIRLRPSGEPGYAIITEVVSPEQVRADVKRVFANA